MHAVTELLAKSRSGDSDALAQLYAQLYPEIKRLARARLHDSGGRRIGLDTTGLAHEGFLRMAEREGLRGESRAQFFAYVGQVLRSVVIDEIRAAQRDKRGGGEAVWVTLSAASAVPAAQGDPLDLVTVNEALTKLRDIDASLAELLDLVGFAGLDVAEVAELRGVTPRTVQRDLAKARAFLNEML